MAGKYPLYFNWQFILRAILKVTRNLLISSRSVSHWPGAWASAYHLVRAVPGACAIRMCVTKRVKDALRKKLSPFIFWPNVYTLYFSCALGVTNVTRQAGSIKTLPRCHAGSINNTARIFLLSK